jgi:hypothetical protein
MKSSAEEVKKELKTDTVNQTKLFCHLYQKNNTNDDQNCFAQKFESSQSYSDIVSSLRKYFIVKGFCLGSLDYLLLITVKTVMKKYFKLGFVFLFNFNISKLEIIASIDTQNEKQMNELFSLIFSSQLIFFLFKWRKFSNF